MLAHVVGLNLGQSLVGYFLSFCSIFDPAYLVGRISFGLRVLWVCVCVCVDTQSGKTHERVLGDFGW